MRRVLVIACMVVVGCKHAPRGPTGRYRAVGTLIHDGLGADDAAGWATELEILRSGVMVDDVIQELSRRGRSVAPDLVRRGLTVTRRAESRVIEVSVRLDDRQLAAAACDLIIERYIDRRLDATRSQTVIEERALQQELDELRPTLDTDGGANRIATSLYENKVARLSALQVQDGMLRSDVRKLDPCQVEGRAR